MNKPILYLLAFLGAAATTALSLPFWRGWCSRHGLVDDPGERKIHGAPIPLAGGLAVMTGMIAALVCGTIFAQCAPSAGVLGLFQYGLGRRILPLLGITAGAVCMMITGLRDDQVELRPGPKFLCQLLAVLVVAATGVRVTLFVPSLVFSYAITALWILTVVNAFNFMDNMNGLCAGLAVIGAAWFGLLAAHAGQYLVASIAFVIAGASTGFLPYNFPRATAFLGDSGSHLLGYLLAILGILPHYYTRTHPHAWAVLTPVLVLAVPLGDLVWVVLLRWKMGRPFYVGDTNHLSHRLTRRGWTKAQSVALIWGLAAILGGLAYLWQ